MRGKIVYEDPINAIIEIEVGEHKIEIGGPGDGYCYPHQSFNCLDRFTDEERRAFEAAD